MISPDVAIVSAILKEGGEGLRLLTKKGFDKSLLADRDCKKAVEYVKQFYEDFGEMPSKELMDSTFPSVFPDTVPQGVRYYLKQLNQRHKFSIIKNANSAIVEMLDSDSYESITSGVDEAAQILIQAARKLTLESTEANTYDITKTAKQRLEQYQERKEKSGITGIPTFWLPLTLTTRGWQNGHTYIISAPSGTGKTFSLILNAKAARDHGYVPLLFTQEMSQIEIATRFDAIDAKIPYGGVLSGELEPEKEAEYIAYLSSLEQSDNQTPFYVNEKAGGKGIDYIISQIEDLKPDIVFIDNIYLFAKSLDYKDILEVSSKLKNVAQKLEIPIVFCTQLNEDGQLSFAKYVKNDVSGDYKIFDLSPHNKRKLVDDKSRDNVKGTAFAFNFDFAEMDFEHDPDFSVETDSSGIDEVLDDLF